MRRIGHQQVHMVVLAIEFLKLRAEVSTYRRKVALERRQGWGIEHVSTILGAKTKCTCSAETTCLPRLMP